MLPKLYKTSQASAPWLVVYSDPAQRDAQGKVKRVRFRFAKRADAKRKYDQLIEETHQAGIVGMAFDASARADAIAARQALDAAGYPGITLLEIARDYARRHVVARHGELPIMGLIAEFLDHQKLINRSARTVDNLKRRLERWAVDAKLGTLGEITEEVITDLKIRPGVAAQTRRNDMAAASSFFSYLVKDRRVLAGNPLQGVSRPTVDLRTPRTFTPEQARALLESALRHGGGRLARYFILCLMAGLRPSEAAAVDPSNVVLSHREKFVRVLAGKRRGHRRNVPLSTAFQAWWQIAPAHELPLYDQNRDRYLFDLIRRDAGLIPPLGKRDEQRIWQDDICRHTWISARLAVTQDEAQVALEAGTSRTMIHMHYLDWLTLQVAQEILTMRPR